MLLRTIMTFLACAAMSVALAETGDHRVSVEFVDSDRYTDAGDRPRDHERNLARLEEFLAAEVGHCLSEGQRVDIRVLDVDLAGRFEWWHRPDGVRIMRNVDFPRMKLEFEFHADDGELIDERREWMTSMDYLERGARLPTRRVLGHEQRMIRDWASERFCRQY
jgi:hypothetical protein